MSLKRTNIVSQPTMSRKPLGSCENSPTKTWELMYISAAGAFLNMEERGLCLKNVEKMGMQAVHFLHHLFLQCVSL
jgi:hypothetical protein